MNNLYMFLLKIFGAFLMLLVSHSSVADTLDDLDEFKSMDADERSLTVCKNDVTKSVIERFSSLNVADFFGPDVSPLGGESDKEDKADGFASLFGAILLAIVSPQIHIPENPDYITGFKLAVDGFSFDKTEGEKNGGSSEIRDFKVSNIVVDTDSKTIKFDYETGYILNAGSTTNYSAEEVSGTSQIKIKPRKKIDVEENCMVAINKLPANKSFYINEDLQRIGAGKKGSLPAFFWEIY